MKKYRIDKEIEHLRQELIKIPGLRRTTQTEGWGDIVKAFNDEIGKYHQDIFDLSDEPSKHEMEIKCKKMVAKSLGSILSALDSRVQSEEYVRSLYTEKTHKVAVARDIQELQTI